MTNSRDERAASHVEQADSLRQLASPSKAFEAAQTLLERDWDISRALVAGLLSGELDTLIPAWIDRLIEQLMLAQRAQQEYAEALAEGRDLPAINLEPVIVASALVKTLRASHEGIDPHLGPMIVRLGTLDDQGNEHLMKAMDQAGPAVRGAVPKLLRLLNQRGRTLGNASLAQTLAHASQYDDRVLIKVRRMLSSPRETSRLAALEVLGAIGPGARSVADDLVAFRRGTECERRYMLHALAKLGTPSSELLDVLHAAMSDPSGYVRCSAATAIGTLTPEPARFVPLLIEACDWTEFLHDESLPETAIEALACYGEDAAEALPRLRQFLEGPLQGRSVNADLVREALSRITREPAPVTSPAPGRRRAEPIPEDEYLFPVQQDGKLCYLDRDGCIVLCTKYSYGEAFSDERAIVYDEDGGAFVIDRQGRDVFGCGWDDIRRFSEGLAPISIDGKWGFVNRDGNVALEPQYDSVTRFSEGLAGFEVGREDVSLGEGISLDRIGRRGFIDHSGKMLISAEWADACPFKEGRALVCAGGTWKSGLLGSEIPVFSNRKYGFIDQAGQLVIPGRYDLVSSFSGGRAMVQIGDGFVRARYGYVDGNGDEVIPLEFKSASDFHEGLAVVQRRGKRWRDWSCVINLAGTIVGEIPYQLFGPYSEGLFVAWSGEAFGYLNVQGEWVIEPRFHQANPFEHGLAEIQHGDWYGLINQEGKFVWGPTTEGGLNHVIESEWV